ncbi:hypothetical protein MZM54_00490 [[Brevibacterium] frigoritolerans]|nr:hypothetical protein [Peribacillus frigoritolerans]
MSRSMKVRRKYHHLFECGDELINVHYEDLNGYIHYEHSDDPTKQIYTMTPVELLKYQRVTLYLE